MKITYDLPLETKDALEDLKKALRREGFPAFERRILIALIDTANVAALRRYFAEETSRRKQTRRRPTGDKTGRRGRS